jgi:hypothetical protein
VGRVKNITALYITYTNDDFEGHLKGENGRRKYKDRRKEGGEEEKREREREPQKGTTTQKKRYTRERGRSIHFFIGNEWRNVGKRRRG